MKSDYDEMKMEVEQLVKRAAYSPENKFTSTVWDYHIVPVVDHALNLGRKMGADLEVLELAALFHDYACLVDFEMYEEHHRHSAELAGRELHKLNYSQEKIEHIKKCIFSHRGSTEHKKESLEAEIIASADAMSHVTEIPDMFYLAYGVHKYQTREGAEWLKGKLERSWNKIMDEGRDMIRAEYALAVEMITKATKKKV